MMKMNDSNRKKKNDESMRKEVENFYWSSMNCYFIDHEEDRKVAKTMQNALLVAIRENYPSCVQYLMTKTSIQNPLSLAVQYDSIDCLRLLLEQGADANEVHSAGLSVLAYAIYGENLDAMKLLLQYGAIVNLPRSQLGDSDDEDEDDFDVQKVIDSYYEHHDYGNDEDDSDASEIGAEVEWEEFMQHRMPSIEDFAIFDRITCYSPFLLACSCENIAFMEILLQHGADANEINPKFDKKSAIHYVGSVKKLELLHRVGAKLDTKTKKGTTALILASGGNAVDCVKFLLDHLHPLNVEDDILPAVVVACRFGKFACLQATLDYIIDVDKDHVDINKYNVIDPSLVGKSLFFHAISSGKMDCIELLLQRGAEVNQLSVDGYTPLYYACKSRETPLVSFLLDHGAKVITYDTDGRVKCNALRACIDKKYNVDIIDLLLREDGVDVNAVSPNGMKMLLAACYHSHLALIQMLLQHGADPDQCDCNGETPLMAAILSQYPITIIKLLLDYGADINLTNRYGKNALYHATANNMPDIAEFLVSRGAIEQ